MILKYFTAGLIFGISASVISWIVSMVLNSVLMKTAYYKKLSNLNFIKSEKLNQKIGIKYFKWIVKNTFFKFFNQNIKIENKKTDLIKIRNEMTYSEISHLIGFVLVLIFAINKVLAKTLYLDYQWWLEIFYWIYTLHFYNKKIKGGLTNWLKSRNCSST